METNRLQQHICDFIIEQVQWWRDSDDINSTTHLSGLESRLDELEMVEGWITESKAHELDFHLTNLLVCIRGIKE